MLYRKRQALCALLALLTLGALAQPALAAGAVTLMPDVTAEMSDAAYWADRQPGADQIILTLDEIKAFNQDSAEREGTMVMDLRTADETYDGPGQNERIRSSATADAEYYFGWTYTDQGEPATWEYYEEMIENCVDPAAEGEMSVRYGIAVKRTLLRVFPSDRPILDDPADTDFDYQSLSGIRVNEPMLIYNTSADGKYYLARISSCSGWVPAEDVALCEDKDEWLSAWDLPSEKLLVVYGNKEYTDASNTAPQTARRMLTQGTALELVTDLEPDQLIGNRSPYHNYVVYLPVRRDDGSYEKQLALIPETAQVSVGYLPLTMRNIAMVALDSLGDAYGWGGMLDVEDCSGMVRTVYSCFGLDIGRNSTWQSAMNIEQVDMTNMSREEKLLLLDRMPLGAALCFNGHEMMYLGKVDGKYYVVSTVSSIVSPTSGKVLRTRDVMINTLDVKRGSGASWLGALNQAFMPCYAKLDGKSYDFPNDLAWYHDGVAFCLDRGLMPALDIDNTFGIGQSAGRGDLAYGLWTLAGSPDPVDGTCPFDDVAEDDPARTAILWAAETGIVPALSDRAFGPDGAVGEQEMLYSLWLLAQSQDLPGAAESAFAFDWAVRAGVIGGDDWALPVGDPLTREDLALFLSRYGQALDALAAAEEAAEEVTEEAPAA